MKFSGYIERMALVTVAVLLTVCSCARMEPAPAQSADFQHAAGPPPFAWNHEQFDARHDAFSFAVFADLTGGERAGVFDVAMAQLRILRPELILSVGDLIEGGNEDHALLNAEWDSFDSRAGAARAPLFRVGGNHDLTNPVQWQVWEQRYGLRYYYFIYKGVLFLVLDTEDNTAQRQQEMEQARVAAMARVEQEGWGAMKDTAYYAMPETKSGRVSPEQAAYFRDVIARYPQVRWTFVFLHKAVWERPGEENFAAIEAALSDRPYTVFHGHEHAYQHQLRNGRDYIRLGTTGGVQFAHKPLSVDHVTLVSVSGNEVDIANIRLSGLFDKTGRIPAGGDALCFDPLSCASPSD